jgi:hypothetical protein
LAGIYYEMCGIAGIGGGSIPPPPTADSMALAIQIFLVLLVLAAFVIAFFSARTWHWAYVLVVLGIFLSTLGFFVLAAETLRIYAILGTEANRLQQELADYQQRNDALVRGTDDQTVMARLRAAEVDIDDDADSLPSLAELDHQLHVATMHRGRVWRNVAPANVDQQTGVVGVADVELREPSSFRPPNLLLYLGKLHHCMDARRHPAVPSAGQGEARILEGIGLRHRGCSHSEPTGS